MKYERLEPSVDLPNRRFRYLDAEGTKALLTSPVTQDRTYRILCVDDEVIATQMRGEILEQHGYSVVLYHHPSEALSCDLSAFDLGVLDFDMPGLNGRELLLRMRSLGAKFPILLLSGNVDNLSREDRVLFACCIDKARPIQLLLDSIAKLLDPNQAPDFGA